jgi:hypothetical protein
MIYLSYILTITLHTHKNSSSCKIIYISSHHPHLRWYLHFLFRNEIHFIGIVVLHYVFELVELVDDRIPTLWG